MKFACELCGTIYDEQIGDLKHGIPAGTAFADLPANYCCSICGSEKEAFSLVKRQVYKTAVRNDRDFWLDAKYSVDNLESDR